MKKITINGFNLAIFIVGGALHVTVRSLNKKLSVDHKEFKNVNPPSLFLYNEFSEIFKCLPTVWTERVIKDNHDGKNKILIIIIK